ncbi:MAG: hypothetical protein MUC97_00765 [Bernardetiaceae bacterium]|jgi:hypothetical protein|nr:hypothetical protein [Bernardetiaceae bacterium]
MASPSFFTPGRRFFYWGLAGALLLGTTACLKLKEKKLEFDARCAGCARLLQDSLLALPGVHLAQPLNDSTFLIKYDTAQFRTQRLYQLLSGGGFANDPARPATARPACCR